MFAIYGTEAALMGLAGSLVGARPVRHFQAFLPGLFTGLLPVDVEVALSWRAVLVGIGMGLWVALVFALLPLLAVRRVPPLAVLRRPFESERQPRDRWRWAAMPALAASTVGLAALQVGSLRQGAIFAGAVGVALLLLWAAAGR